MPHPHLDTSPTAPGASNPYAPPAQPIAAPAPVIAPVSLHPSGIGGWLLLPALGVVLTPFSLISYISGVINDIILTGTWTQLTTPGNDGYHVMWAPLLVTELVLNTTMVFVWFYALYLLCTKKRVFPSWFIRAHVASLVFIVVDMVGVKIVRPDLPMLDPETGKEPFRSVWSVCVWVPYMLLSKRVAATFIR